MESFINFSSVQSYSPACGPSLTRQKEPPYQTFKLVFDLAFTIPLVCVLAPIMLVIALLIKLDSPGPIIYKRHVIGENGRPFFAYKFRTMYTHGDALLAAYPQCQAELAHRHKIRHDPRITPLGHFLRRCSLDELPQLFNVIRRDMSLIGPRMVTREELSRFGDVGPLMVSVKPGISGLWQISGRADTPYSERIYLNTVYILQWTPWLDISILLRTIPVVLSGKGAY